MDNNSGIVVSQPQQTVYGATGSQVLMTTKYPFFMADTTNSNSYVTFNLFFIDEPPTPSVGNHNTTLVYSYPHNYSYPPQFWALGYITIPPISGTYQQYFMGTGLLNGQDVGDYAYLRVSVDSQNVNIYVDKSLTFGIGNPNVQGVSIDITVISFVTEIQTS